MKKLLTLLLSCLTLFAFSACGGDKDAGKETITFVCNAGYVLDFEKRVAEFNKIYPDIKVEVSGIAASSWGEMLQTISTDIASGEIPDVADIASEGMYAFADAGLLEPIDDWLIRDEAELADTIAAIEPNLINAHKINGKTYSLPTVWNNMCMYYNKNVLREAGLSEPQPGWTTEDFLTMCKTIVKNNNGGNNDVYGYSFYNGYFTTIEPWLEAFGSSVLTDDWSASAMETAASQEALRFLYDLVNTHKVSPAMGTSDIELFVQNKLGFMGCGMWYVESLKNMGFSADEYDVVPFPSKDGSIHSVIGVGGVPVFKASKHKEAAWKFSKFLADKDFQEGYLTDNIWAIPSVKTAASKISEKAFFPSHSSVFYDAASYGKYVPAPAYYTTIEGAVLRSFGAYISKAKPLDQIVSEAAAAINEALGG